MVQPNIYRLEFLKSRKLLFLPGLLHEDNEFFPRSLYLAKRIIPLHELFYRYRKRVGSITTTKKTIQHLPHLAVGLRSLCSLAMAASAEPSFEPRIAKCWAQYLLHRILRFWFTQEAITSIPRAGRRDTLKVLFNNGMDHFRKLAKADIWQRQVIARMICLFVQYPCLGWFCDGFFKCHDALHKIKANLFRKKE